VFSRQFLLVDVTVSIYQKRLFVLLIYKVNAALKEEWWTLAYRETHEIPLYLQFYTPSVSEMVSNFTFP